MESSNNTTSIHQQPVPSNAAAATLSTPFLKQDSPKLLSFSDFQSAFHCFRKYAYEYNDQLIDNNINHEDITITMKDQLTNPNLNSSFLEKFGPSRKLLYAMELMIDKNNENENIKKDKQSNINSNDGSNKNYNTKDKEPETDDKKVKKEKNFKNVKLNINSASKSKKVVPKRRWSRKRKFVTVSNVNTTVNTPVNTPANAIATDTKEEKSLDYRKEKTGSNSDTSETFIRSNVHGHINSPIHYDNEDSISSSKSIDSEAVMTTSTRTTSVSTCTTASPLLLSTASFTSSNKSKPRSRTRLETKTRTRTKSTFKTNTIAASPTSRQQQQQQSPSNSIPTSVVLTENDLNLDFEDDDEEATMMTKSKVQNSEDNEVIITNKDTIFGSSLVDSDNSSPSLPEQSMFHYTTLSSATTMTPQQRTKQKINYELVIEQRNALGGRVRYGSSTKKTHSSRKRKRRQTYGGRSSVAGNSSITGSKEVETPNLQSWEDRLYQLKPTDRSSNSTISTTETAKILGSSSMMKSVSFHSSTNTKKQGKELIKERERERGKKEVDNDNDSDIDDFVFHSQSSQPYEF